MNLVNRSYKLIDRDSLSEKEYSKYLNKYPLLGRENLYVLNKPSKKDIKELDSVLAKAILIVWGIEQGDAEQGLSKHFEGLPEGIEPFEALKNLPNEQLETIKAKIDEQFGKMPESLITQSAINFIKMEYEIIGVNIQRNQSNYILYIGGIMLLIALLSRLPLYL